MLTRKGLKRLMRSMSERWVEECGVSHVAGRPRLQGTRNRSRSRVIDAWSSGVDS